MCQGVFNLSTPSVLLTQEGGGRDGAIAAGDHDADPCLDEGHRELHDLWPFLVDSEGAYGHVGPLGYHLEGDGWDLLNRELRDYGSFVMVRWSRHSVNTFEPKSSLQLFPLRSLRSFYLEHAELLFDISA